MRWQKLQSIVLVAFLAVVVASLFAFGVFGADFDLESAREKVASYGIWAPVAFLVLYIIITVFIPSTPIMALAGILFGFWYGLAYCFLGGIISSLAVFHFTRVLGKEKAEKILEHKYLAPIKKYNRRLESGGIWDLIFLRILPILPFNALNIIMGMSKIKTKNYLVGTIVGLAPSNILAVYLGNVLTKFL